MSIPDNPFQAPTTPQAPVLQIHTDNASPTSPSPDAEHVLSSPYSHTSSPGPIDGSPHSGHISPPGQTTTSTPGGLAPPDSGIKNRRRVQWTSDSHIVQLHPIQPVPSSPHQLDEGNIDQFRDALEAHRNGSIKRTRPPSQLSRQSSADGSETRGGTEDEDYDYRLDVDPPLDRVTSAGSNPEEIEDNGMNEHVPTYIDPGERDGLPNIPQMSTQDEDHRDAAKDLVRAHTGKWGVLRRRVKTSGNINRAFGAGRLGATSSTTADPEKQDQDSRASQEAFAARYPEPRRHSLAASAAANGRGGAPAMPGGASVLSSLLALYGQQDGMQSGTTSAASSRPNSDDEGSSEDEAARRRSGEHHKGGKGFLGLGKKSASSSNSNGTPANEVAIHDEPHRASISAEATGEPLAPQPSRYSNGERPPPSPGLSGLFQRTKEQLQYKRPEAAKSGAGVFGALIQNTANLSGAATPAASALAPAAKRPGYQLNRYSAPNLEAEEGIKNWRPPSRPQSRAGSRGGSRPASVHSSTAVSQNGDSPSDDFSFKKKAISSDDLVGMRERERERQHTDDSSLTLNSKFNSSTMTLGDVKQNKRPKSGVGHLKLDSLAAFPVKTFKEGGKQIKSAEKWLMSAAKTPLRTPPEKGGMDYFTRPLTEDERRRKEWEAEKKRRKKAREARKKQEIFIIQHVAAILARQQFLMKLARALMMFGSPSHRLETQIQATAKVLEINAQVVYMPGTMLISFGDDATHTSETKFLKQATGLDLGKLLATHHLYWNVVHDKMSVEQASKDLDVLMTTPVYYNWWQSLLIGAMCSAFITVISFYGSFVDALMAMPLGALLVGVQMLAARNDMFSNVFEIAIATVISFVSAALASTEVFCYTALVSGGVVLILPGYIVLCGALELASRNITAGAVRIGYSVIYSLFLGFGISIGAVLYEKITHNDVLNASDYTCANTHGNAHWYQVTPSPYWYFLCCPGYAFFLSLRNQQPLWAKELPIMVVVAAAGWSSNHFSSLAFPGRSDMTSAIGSFVVGTLGNLYGRISNGSSFPVTVTGILFQLPSGLSNGGIFNFAAESSDGSSTAYSSGFSVAQQLVSVAIGLTVGLFVSAAVTHPFGGGRRRGAGIFSF
ncbi:uncharacterized protein I206_104734 [Kwoniella pini CBS 10737]|uniref:Pheromone-regulated membrane protein 10 n=1 Tax=Kwoniella pini CBS 10737 TaxID=1296096 RepID=A0A1B9I7L5_9TREE|nr:uncharacterized protein I206_02272 [Kwoniella pini CBS 10737]OCF51557.1 hypothetical protein I206_02272 [Kwoniella pini CBS 10737]